MRGWYVYKYQVTTLLKGQCHKIFDFWFYHESVSPKPLSVLLGPFWIFLKICGDIRSSRCTTSVVDKIFNQKNFNSFVWTPWGSRVNIHISIFAFKFTLRCLQPAKFPLFSTGVVDTGDASWLANISTNFWKNSGAWGKVIHEKTWIKKSCDTVPLKVQRTKRFRKDGEC